MTYAATPATCGHDIEVPERTEYFTCLVSFSDSSPSGEYAARISTPGPVISGCNSSTIVSQTREINRTEFINDLNIYLEDINSDGVRTARREGSNNRRCLIVDGFSF